MKEKTSDVHEASMQRRGFLKQSAKVIGGVMMGASLPFEINANPVNDDTIKIALIGCGARGAGAAVNALRTKGKVELIAMADVFKDKLDDTYDTLNKIENVKASVKVPEQNKFIGFDAYKKAIPLADVVLLVTPAPFRPVHFEAAVNAGKHVFMEKPLASDAPGIRKILATNEIAKQKKLKVQVGLQNRYDPNYIEMVNKLKDGAIGDIISSTDYYMIGPVKQVLRQPGQTEMEYQMRNWRYFNWLWAGSPAGLAIHNTDIVNWVKGSHPVRAQAMGGRCALGGPEHGDIFDHFFIEYEYPDGTKLNSQIRHITGTWNRGGANFQGSKGSASFQGGIKDMKGNQIWKVQNKVDPYQTEVDQFFSAIRNNTPLNDVEWAAMSTMTTILGRMAAHSGKLIEWDEAIKSELSLLPQEFNWDSTPPAKPDKNGNYPIAVPGKSPAL